MSWSRPITGSIAAGAVTVNIPLNRHAGRTKIDVVLTGANTFSIDSTQDSIHFDTETDPVPVNFAKLSADHVPPASAQWVEEQASASATSTLALNSPVAAVRIVKTVGAGTAEYRIQQT